MIEGFLFSTLSKRIHGTTGNSKMEENLDTANILFTESTRLWVIENKYMIY